MSVKLKKSTRSKKSNLKRTEFQPYPDHRLCRYTLRSNRRCRSIAGPTGSGLCPFHDRLLFQLRDAESRTLGHEALGDMTDLNTDLAIHTVFARIVMLGLARRYSPREVSVFNSAFRTLSKTIAGAHDDLRKVAGYNAEFPLIANAVANDPTFAACVPQRTVTVSKSKSTAPIEDVSSRARASARGTCSSPSSTATEIAQSASSSVGAGLDRESGQVPPTANVTTTPNPPRESATHISATPAPAAPIENVSSRARASARGTCSPPSSTTTEIAQSTQRSVGAGLDRESGQVPPTANVSPNPTSPHVPATPASAAPIEDVSSRARASARGTCSSPSSTAGEITAPASPAIAPSTPSAPDPHANKPWIRKLTTPPTPTPTEPAPPSPCHVNESWFRKTPVTDKSIPNFPNPPHVHFQPLPPSDGEIPPPAPPPPPPPEVNDDHECTLTQTFFGVTTSTPCRYRIKP